MTEQQKELGAKLLGVASAVRRCKLKGDKKLNAIIEESGVNPGDIYELIRLVDMLVAGTSKENIVSRLNMSTELVERLDHAGIYDW